MGKIYRATPKGCPLCKPWNYGWSPKKTDRDLQEERLADGEISLALRRKQKQWRKKRI